MLAAGLLAGCYSPSVPSEVPCSSDGECPSGQSCVASKCEEAGHIGSGSGTDTTDAGVGMPTADDMDGDGVPDEMDNCPTVANKDQADEDGDKIGDACDPCPQIAGTASDPDTDKDGVGDACDPNPTLKDRVWLFNGFNDATVPSYQHSLNWTVASPGVLQAASAGGNAATGEYLIPPFTTMGTTIDNFSVTTVMSVTTPAGNGDHVTGIDLFDSTQNRILECGLSNNSNDVNNGKASVYVWEYDNQSGNNTGNGIKTTAVAWTMSTEYRITMTRHGQAVTCMMTGTAPGGLTAMATSTSTVTAHDNASISLFAYGTTALFKSVDIIGSP
jgi:hypothetical protein